MVTIKIDEVFASPLSAEEIFKNKIIEVEQAIQAHIVTVVTSFGYDSENSIAKYLVDGNPFYLECKAISLWIGAVWVKVHETQLSVLAGGDEPTIEELIALLPIYSGAVI